MKKKIIIFNSYPDYSDNSYAIFKYFVNNNLHMENELIWLTSTANPKVIAKKINNEFSLKIKCYKKKSLLGVLNYLKASEVFFTHGLFSFIKLGKRKKVNLWHGMPLKKIGYLQKENKGIEKFTCDYLIATSKIFKSLMSKSFRIEEKKIFLTGQPRNDLFFEKTKFYEKMKINKNDYTKIIMYLPTFRKSIVGQIRNDGKYNESKLGILEIEKLTKLDKELLKNNNLMIIKLHPMDVLQEKKFKKLSNVIILKTEDLERIDEQLYPLLGSTDLLITDYSSVWIDYEILGKPIYFAMDDYEEYKSNRGFTIENLPELLPGDIIQDFETLLKKLEDIPDKIQKETGDIFNKYKDNKSCERVLKALGIL